MKFCKIACRFLSATGILSFVYMLGLAGESDLGGEFHVVRLFIALIVFAISVLGGDYFYNELQHKRRARSNYERRYINNRGVSRKYD